MTGASGSGTTVARADHTHTMPTIPTVNDPAITIKQGGVVKNTITLNQSGNATVDLHDIVLFKDVGTPFIVGEWNGVQVKRLCFNSAKGNFEHSSTTFSVDLSSYLPANYCVVDIKFIIGFMAPGISVDQCKDNVLQSYYASSTDYLYYKFSNGIMTFYFNARGQARIDSYIIVDFK